MKWHRSFKQRIILQNDVKGPSREQLSKKAHLWRGNDRSFPWERPWSFNFLISSFQVVGQGLGNEWSFYWERPWSFNFLIFTFQVVQGWGNGWSFPWEWSIVLLGTGGRSLFYSSFYNLWLKVRERLVVPFGTGGCSLAEILFSSLSWLGFYLFMLDSILFLPRDLRGLGTTIPS